MIITSVTIISINNTAMNMSYDDSTHRISFTDFENTKKVIQHAEHMDRAVKKYLRTDGVFDKEQFAEAAYAVTGLEISRDAVDVLFILFDLNNDGLLTTDEFATIVRGAAVGNKLIHWRGNSLGVEDLSMCLYKVRKGTYHIY